MINNCFHFSWGTMTNGKNNRNLKEPLRNKATDRISPIIIKLTTSAFRPQTLPLVRLVGPFLSDVRPALLSLASHFAALYRSSYLLSLFCKQSFEHTRASSASLSLKAYSGPIRQTKHPKRRHILSTVPFTFNSFFGTRSRTLVAFLCISQC